MKRQIVLIIKEDIVFFPPVISIMQALVSMKYQVFHIGTFSNQAQKQYFEKLGVVFLPATPYKGKANILKKFYSQLRIKKDVEKHLKGLSLSKSDFVWIFQSETILLLHNLVKKYPCILHQFEFGPGFPNWKYRLLTWNVNVGQLYRRAKKVVSCEYNRAHITKGILQLHTVPYILPNKTILDENSFAKVSEKEKNLIDRVEALSKGKKIILYQGIFVDEERCLEEFCQAIQLLPKEYILLIMGRGNELYDKLREKYEGERVIFLPFIAPPYHLRITRLARIGVLTYFPRPDSVSSVINPIYCAPNKTFEYAKFGLPMISNDIPALHYTFKEFQCGVCVEYPMTAKAIVEVIKKIETNYSSYSEESHRLYESVDIQEIVRKIIES